LLCNLHLEKFQSHLAYEISRIAGTGLSTIRSSQAGNLRSALEMWAREADPALVFLRFILRFILRFSHRFKLPLAAAAALLNAASPGLRIICYQHWQ
jgi:hypothetical protein